MKNTIVQQATQELEVRVQKVVSHRLEENDKLAQECLLSILNDYPLSEMQLHNLAITLGKNGDFQDAIYLLKKLIKNNPDNKIYQLHLADTYKIAKKHNCSIANVSTRFVLDRPQVAGVIIGARLGIANHREDNSKVFDVKLDDEDISSIRYVTAKSNDLFDVIGDCGDEYR